MMIQRYSSSSFVFVCFFTKSNTSVPRIYNANNIDGPNTNPPGANAHPHHASFSMYAKSDTTAALLITLPLGTIASATTIGGSAREIVLPLLLPTLGGFERILRVKECARAGKEQLVIFGQLCTLSLGAVY